MILLVCKSDVKQSQRNQHSWNGNSGGKKNLNMKEDSEKGKKVTDETV